MSDKPEADDTPRDLPGENATMRLKMNLPPVDNHGAGMPSGLQGALGRCKKTALEDLVKGLCDIYVSRKSELLGDSDFHKDIFKTVFRRLEWQRGRIIGRFDRPFEDVDEFGCDGCNQDPIDGSVYHKVGDCDLCERCYDKLDEVQKDSFTLEESPVSSVAIDEYSCDGDSGGCDEDPIVGRRFHKIEDFDLCQTCFKKIE